MTADAAIIGGGPAGLAAARELRSRGIENVIVFDREFVAGGTPRHCDHPPFGLLEFGRIMKGPSYARKLVETALAAGVSILTGHSVVELGESGRLRVATPEGRLEVEAARVIIATGSRESSRAARLISGDRPLTGCLTTGALQSFLHEYQILPFRRPLILGTELVSLSAMLTCRKAGIHPAAVVHEQTSPGVPWPLGAVPRLLGIPLHRGAKIVELRGAGQVESAAIRLSDGEVMEISCDGLLCTGRFVPEAGILRQSGLTLDPLTGGPLIDRYGRCSDKCYFATGNVSHETKAAVRCYRDGRRTGAAVAADLAGRLPAAS